MRSLHHARRALVSCAAALALLSSGLTPGEALAGVRENVLAPTPLILKDGRIAYVVVHSVPFEPGRDTLSPEAEALLDRFLIPVTTDCFLTAQAIGHVAPGAGGDGDAVEAFRLAQGRANTVQRVMIERGVEPESVASVWDWQFLVRDSRVTLWIFSLNQGEDCEGAPLSGNVTVARSDAAAPEAPVAPPPRRENRVAAADAAGESAPSRPQPVTGQATNNVAGESLARITQVARPAEQPRATPAAERPAEKPPARAEAPAAAARPEPAPEPVVARASEDPAPAVSDADDEETAPVIASEDEAEALPEPASVTPPAQNEERVVAAQPAPVPAPARAEDRPAEGAAAENAQPETSDVTEEAPAAPTRTAALPAGDGAEAEVVFAVNSSFLPGSATAELRGFLDGLAPGQSYVVEVAAAVGGSADVSGATRDEALRYNRWMAERRHQRVSEWLDGNAGDVELTFLPRLVEDDDSRSVRISARPAPSS